MSWNSLALSLNEMISVGHTKVLQDDKQREIKGIKTTVHPLQTDEMNTKHKDTLKNLSSMFIEVKGGEIHHVIHPNSSCVAHVLTNPVGRRRAPGICP